MEQNHYLDILSKSKLSDFKKLVKNAGGRVITLIHPYFMMPEGNKIDPNYIVRLENLIKKSNFPIMIFEEEKKVELLKKKLKELEVPMKKIMIITTYLQSPVPIYKTKRPFKVIIKGKIIKIKHANTTVMTESDFYFINTFKLIKRLSVKKIYFGGSMSLSSEIKDDEIRLKIMEYEKTRKKTNKNRHIIDRGCVGVFYNAITEHIIRTNSPIKIIPINNVLLPHKPTMKTVPIKYVRSKKRQTRSQCRK
jgi:hypothetical protein